MSDNMFSLGTGLRATVMAIHAIVNEMHNLEVPEGYCFESPIRHVPRDKVYHTPSFIRGRGPSSPQSKPYTALHISTILGNNYGQRTHNVVYMALDLLELNEMGACSDQDMQDIFNDADGFNSTLLQQVLRLTKTKYYEKSATAILSSTTQL